MFALDFGTGNLIQNSDRLSHLQDAEADPDGGWPSITTGVAAAKNQERRFEAPFLFLDLDVAIKLIVHAGGTTNT